MPRLTIEQLRARHDGIGSSDVPEALGISPYEGASPLRLFVEKASPFVAPVCGVCDGAKTLASGGGERRACPGCGGTGADEIEDEAMELGHVVEPAILSYYSSKRGIPMEPGGTVYSAKLPWAFATVDAHATAAMHGYEVKFVGGQMIRQWDRYVSDGVPQYVRAQNAWQMFCTGYDRIVTLALLGGPSGFTVFQVERDAELEDLIVERVVRFWENVKRGVAPDVDASDAARAYLDAKYPAKPVDVNVIVEEPEIVALGIDNLTAKAIIDDATARRKLLGNKLVEYMGQRGASVATCSDWRATYRPDKNQKRSLKISALGELRATGTVDTVNAGAMLDDGDDPF